MSLTALHHLILLPVLLPLLCGAWLMVINESRHQRKFIINMISVVVQLLTALGLMWMSGQGYWNDGIAVYLSGNWAAPFGIVLLLDRLAVLMLVLTSVLAVCALVYAMTRWSRIGVHFHSLFQFLLMGLNGALLTHDLFNLFVFFEVMLAASYGLLLHGYNVSRIRAGMMFIAVNLVASLFFLIGVALIYAATGTLNMSDLAARTGGLDTADAQLFKVGAGILALAFLVKGAMWPLCFWLPPTYSAASPPVAAMMTLMTKMGVYVVLRLSLLMFSPATATMAGFGSTLLLWGGLATVVYGAAGMLASDRQGKLASYAAITSSGVLFAVIGLDQPSLIAPLLYYLISSTLALAALLLLIELIDRCRNAVESMLAITMEAFGVEETPEQPVGIPIAGGIVILALAFAACTLVITGLPPLSGFIAKFTLFHSLLDITSTDGSASRPIIIVMAVVLLSGLAAIIALMRFGIRAFWATGKASVRFHISEAAPIVFLLLLCVLMTLMAAPVFAFLETVSLQLQQPQLYMERVLGEPTIPGPYTPDLYTQGLYTPDTINGGTSP